MMKYTKELKTAKKAVYEAAKIIRNHTENRSFDIKFKGKNDLVTDADLEAEQTILEVISNAFPDDQVLAEETEREAVMPGDRTWMIDPIDGTTNFAHGFPVYCVSIGLWENQQPKVGVVLEVYRNDLFTAVAGNGAFLNGEQIHVSELKDFNHSLIGTGFPYNDLSILEHYIRFFEWLLHHTQGVRRPGSAAYDLCCVAAGWFDGFYEYSLNPWDVAAASLIVMEAGGKISDWEGGDNWLFGKRLIAGNPAIHDSLLKAIKDMFPDKHLRV